MKYDYRNGALLFKHSLDETPAVYQQRFEEHYHTSYELLYFLKGDAEFVIQHSSYALTEHSLLFMKPGEYHNLIMHTQKPYERIVIRFDEQSLPQALQDKLQEVPNVFQIKNTALSRELLKIDTYVRQISEELLPSLLMGQLLVILSLLCCHEHEYALTVETENNPLREALDYIHDHLQDLQGIDDICAGVHISRSFLQKLFTDQLHSPVMSYVRTQQCLAASELIQKGEAASEVARKCGFENYSTFYRSYMKVFKKPPSTAKQE